MFFQFAALFGWVLLSIREVVFFKPPRTSLVLYGVFVVSMILWVATGFAVNIPGGASFSIIGEVFNVVSKTAPGLAFAVHIGKKPSK